MESLVAMEQENRKRSVAIAGATGIVGGHLVACLLRRKETSRILLLVRDSSSLLLLEKILAFYSLDLKALRSELFVERCWLYDKERLIDLLQGVDDFYDCAGVVSFDERESQRIIRENVQTTHLLCDAALSAGVGRFIYVSSIATLSSQGAMTTVDEQSMLSTIIGKGSYVVGKFFAENEVWRAAAKGLKVVVVNPAVIIAYGNFDGWNTPGYFRLLPSMPFYTQGSMGYVSAEDVARAMIVLAQTEGVEGHRYVLCSDNLPFRELQGLVSRSVGRRGAFIAIPACLLRIAACCVGVLAEIGIRTRLSPRHLTALDSCKKYDGTLIERQTSFVYGSLADYIFRVGNAFVKEHKR